jgi:pimeloyl-ACP methyl ester carboxylesterase
MESKAITVNGCSVYYKVIGQGKPVVLLHGFGEDSSVWNKLISADNGRLTTDNLLIIPDIPGTGKSELLKGDDISISDHADCMKAILDKESISQCTMIGHSMGGYITLAFAEKYGRMLNGFGSFHSSAFADDEEKKATRRKAIEFIKVNGGFAFLKTSLPGLFSEKCKAEHPEVVEAFVEKSKAFTNEALIQYYYAMIGRPDRTEVLKSFSKPVLFIIGDKDAAIPFEASMKQCYLPAISDVHIMQGMGHMGMVEEPEKCIEYIINYLKLLKN